MDKMLKLYKIVDGTEVAFPNDSEQLLLSSFDYSSQRMGNAPIITGTIMHGKCLDDYFNEIKPQEVFIVFNEERYYLKNTPTSSFSNTDARYKHDVEFVSERIKLSNVYFYDVVSSDVENDKPVSNSSVVTFSGNIREFAARLNYSLQYAKLQTVSDDGVVSGYNVVVDDDVSADEYKLVSFSNQYFEAVLQQTFELYGVPYYFKGKTIHFGWTDANSVINETLKYGKDNSLLSITKSNANNQIINRCTGTGSADNISFYYPNNSELGELEYTLKDNKGNVLNDDFFVKNYNVLAKSVEVGTTYQYYDTTNYIDMEVLGAYFCKKEGDSPTTAWERISYGDDHVAFNTYINIKTYGGVVVPTFHHYRIDFKIKAEATVNLTFKAGVTTPTQDGSQFFFDLSDARFVRLFKGEYSPTNYAIRTLKTSGDNISFHLEEPDVYSLEVFDIDVTKIYPTLNNASCALMFFNVKNISAEDRTQEWRNEKGHTFRNLKKVGLTGDETKVPFGSTLSTKVLFRVAPQPNLMPYIYRESRGNERFYNAENNKYLDENNEYYEFANTYIESSPKEHIQQFEDIKPSIEGVVNNAGLPINVFTEFAYDENDNDEMDGENPKHPYFYGKLRKMDGKFGLNIFDYVSEEGEMTISMIDGSCSACQFKIGVDSSTNKNIVQVDENGNLKRDANGDVIRFGSPQDVQNDTKNNEVWVALMKDKDTFNTLMPNATLKPSVGDKFVILHIELPREYVWAAEQKLTDAIIKHMAENNDEKFKFSIKFSRIYLAENPDVLKRLSENSTIRFEYNGVEYFYYVSSFSYRFKSDEALPEINVELSDTIDVNVQSFRDAIKTVRDEIVNAEDRQNQIVNVTLNKYIRNDVDSTSKASIDFENGIAIANNSVKSVIKTSTLTRATDDAIYSAAAVDERINEKLDNIDSDKFLRKDVEDIAEKRIAFKEGLVAGDFLKGSRGVGMYQDSTGNWHVETDYLDVRFKFSATEVEIQKTSHIGGKVINTAANMVATNVIETSSGYICYMNTTDDAGNTIYNTFEVGDQAYCETFNLDKQANGKVGNHFFWRLVTEVGTNYIILSKSDCAEQSDAPLAGDEIVLLGNRTNKERQGAIVQASAGSGSPYIRIYDKIKSYTLPKPKINLSPEGTEISADSIVLQSTGNNMEDEFGSLINITNTLSRELDGSFYVWQGEDNTIPTLENEPAVNWITDDIKQEHIDDFYITTDGFCYQFAYDEATNTYSWKIVTDQYLIKFVEQIGEKRRVFVDMPTDNDVYDIGDTWVNATYTDEELGVDYSNDVLVCIQAKDKGEAFNIVHWRKNSKYTDDTVANLVKKELEDFSGEYEKTIPLLQLQIDSKAETWYQDSDPKGSEGWGEDAKHVGDLWYKESTGETFYFDGTKWNEQNIPVAVFDKFDAKASIYVAKPSKYKANDMWILESTFKLKDGVEYGKGTLVFASQSSETFVASHWSKYDKYTDDTKANAVENKFDTFKQGYDTTIANIQTQLDGKAQTWYQSTNPSINWVTQEEKAEHVGDLWYDTQNEKTFYWDGSTWLEQNLPQDLFDTLDGKSSIFVSKPSSYEQNDMWILESNYTLSGTQYNKGTIVFAKQSSAEFNASHWEKRDKYTDDSALNNFINNDYSVNIRNLNNQIDKKAETWYQDVDPRTSSNWGSDQERIGDMWCTTAGKTQIWNGTEWMQQGIPDEVFDTIDGKSSIFVEKPENGYQERDMWILEKNYVLDKSYKAGTIVVATRDMEAVFNGNDWTKLDSYSDAEEVESIKDDLQSLANKVNSEFAGSFYIWQGDDNTVPTLNNKPAVDWTDDNMRQAHVDDFYISADGVVYQFRNTNGVFSWVTVDDKYIIAYIEQMRSQLLKTGIDIEENVITVTAGQFKVQDRLGNPIAIFEVDTTTGLPTIKGEYLHVNYVNIANKTILLNMDGSGQLAKGKLMWDSNGNLYFVHLQDANNEYIKTVTQITNSGFYMEYFNPDSSERYLKSSLTHDKVQLSDAYTGASTLRHDSLKFTYPDNSIGTEIGKSNINTEKYKCNGVDGISGTFTIGNKTITISGGIITKVE